MKKMKRWFALLACLVMAAGLMAGTAGADLVENDLHLSKTAQYDAATNSVTVTMEAYTTGTVTTEVKPLPTDFVLVLDRSNSMKNSYSETALSLQNLDSSKPDGYYCAVHVETSGILGRKTYTYFYVKFDNGWKLLIDGDNSAGWQDANREYTVGSGYDQKTYNVTDFYVTKLGAMQDAACAFVDQVAAQAMSGNVDHSVAVISYAGNARTEAVLTPLNTSGASASLKSVINSLTVDVETSGTQIHTALAAANGIFTSATSDRKQIVVTLTDGVPSTTDGDGNAFDVALANQTITQANLLKGKSVSMYSIGIFDGANPDQLYGDIWDYAIFRDIACTGNPGSYWGASDAKSVIDYIFGNGFPEIDIPAGNRLLNYISNNYTATEIGITRGEYDPGNRYVSGPGYRIDEATAPGFNQNYYLTAGNIGALKDVFETISNEVTTSNANLDSSAVIRDYVEDYFGNPVNVEVKVATHDGSGFGAELSSGLSYQYNSNTKEISVTGFDYNAHMVKSGNSAAQKLIIRYTVPVRDGFLGGNRVPTNKAESGVYVQDTMFEGFPVPNVDVPIPEISVTAQPKNVYLTGTLPVSSQVDDLNVKLVRANQSLTFALGAVNYGLEAWQTAYIDSIALSAADQTNLTADGTYTVDCVVTPNTVPGGTVTARTFTSNAAAVNVFKPELTYSDCTMYLGGTVPAFGYDSVAWKHNGILDTSVSMVGSAPLVSVSQDAYSPVNGGYTGCTTIMVTAVMINRQNVTQYTSFTHAAAKPEDGMFTLHVYKPTVTFCNSTIYFGNSADYQNNVASVAWKCDHGNPISNGPALSYTYDVSQDAFADCTPVAVTGVMISTFDATDYTALVPADGAPNGKSFTVHVVKPSFSTSGAVIYRGNFTDLTSSVEVGENWTCNHARTLVGTGTGVPGISYQFTDTTTITDAAHYAPTECQEVSVTATVGSKEWTEIEPFTVHVLQPTFTVTAQDVWADCGTAVDLKDNCIVKNGTNLYTVTWSDSQHSNVKNPSEGHATQPTITFDVTLKQVGGSSAVTTHTVGESDADFVIAGVTCKLNGKDFDVPQGSLIITKAGETTDNHDFTVHVNTFALTISKTWDGAEIYKQNAIFDIACAGKETLRVVIPEGEDSITIDGLLCGKTYTVAEDGSWTWRWTSSVSSGSAAVAHSHNGVSTAKPTENHPESVTFTNTLKSDKKLWLDGDAWCDNSFGSKKRILSVLGLG